jgi:hypothetical protein
VRGEQLAKNQKRTQQEKTCGKYQRRSHGFVVSKIGKGLSWGWFVSAFHLQIMSYRSNYAWVYTMP